MASSLPPDHMEMHCYLLAAMPELFDSNIVQSVKMSIHVQFVYVLVYVYYFQILIVWQKIGSTIPDTGGKNVIEN